MGVAPWLLAFGAFTTLGPAPRTDVDGAAPAPVTSPSAWAAPSPAPSASPLPEDPFADAGREREGLGDASHSAEASGAWDPQAGDGERAVPEPTARSHGRLRAVVKVLGRDDPIKGVSLWQGEQRLGEDDDTPDAGTLELWLLPGTQSFELRAPGYRPAVFAVEIERGVQLEMIYRLEEDLDAPRYYTLVESKREVAVSKLELRDEEIHAVAGTRGDPFAVVKSLPGASQVAGFLPYVVVRGAAPGNTGYFLDNVRVPLLFHVALGPSVIHPYFIDAVDFYPGGAPVRLGRYTNGIIEGRSKAAARDRIRGEVDLRITDAGALLHVPFDRRRVAGCTKKRRECEKQSARGSFTLAGRYSYTGLIFSLIPALNVKLRFWDYQARLDHDLGPRARYRAFAYGALDEIGPRRGFVSDVNPDGEVVSRVDDDPDPFLRFHFHRFDQRVDHRPRAGTDVTYGLALGVDQTGVSDIKTNEWRVAPRVIWRRALSEKADIGVGLDQEFQFFRLDQSLDQIDPAAIEDLSLFLSERFVSVTGLWTDLRWRRGRVEMRPGIRMDTYVQLGASPVLPSTRSVTQAVGVDPRLLLRETINERWTLRQSLGVFHQPPSAPIPIPGIESLGFDRGLQRNIQGSFGYELKLGDIGTLTQEAYLGRLSNLQDYEFAASADEQPDELEDFIVRVTGWAYGLETMLKLDPRRRVFGWIAYTLSRSTRDFRVGGRVLSPWDQTHLLNLVLGYRVNAKWNLSGRMHFNTGRPYTAQSRGQTLADALRDNRNNRRLPPFFQFDARVERIFVWDRWRLHMFLDVTNATLSREIFACGGSGGVFAFGGTDPAEDLGTSSAGSELAGCVDPQGIRYILPSVGMRGVF